MSGSVGTLVATMILFAVIAAFFGFYTTRFTVPNAYTIAIFKHITARAIDRLG